MGSRIEEYAVLEDEMKKVARSHEQSEITSLDFSTINPDWLCSSSADGNVKIWDLKKCTKLPVNLSYKTSINSVAWNNNSSCIAAGAGIGDVIVARL